MKNKLLHIPLLALLFAYLFTHRELGLNLIFFQIIALGLVAFHKPERRWSTTQKILFCSSVLLIIFSFVHFSSWAMVWSWISLTTTGIAFQSNKIRQIGLSTLSVLLSGFSAPFIFLRKIGKRVFEGIPKRASAVMYVIPVIAVLVFSMLYAQANPDVDGAFRFLTGHFMESLQRFTANLFRPFFWMTILGVILGSVLFFGRFIRGYDSTNLIENEFLRRRKSSEPGSVEVLKTYYKSALYTIGSLVVVLSVFLFFEVRDVWINFEWAGGELKYFVHNGTYVLIFSIVISALLVIVFFNNRLNFYPDSKLRKLSYVWLGLNAVLAISVIVRTVHYIDNFALAYLRIGVIFFIAACIAGLYSVYAKIRFKKTLNYLFRFNSLVVLVVVVSIAAVNWDRVITQYNFDHRKSAFVHLRYLSEMSDKTLPLLVQNAQNTTELKQTQQELSHLDTRSSYYITSAEYSERIEERVAMFVDEWEKKDFWEWNLPEYLAYKKLTSD
jgi:hypothetical protein